MQVGIASKPAQASQLESRLLVRKAKSQCSDTPERRMIHSCAAPMTPARNNDSDVAAGCGLTSRCLRTTFKTAVGIGELGWAGLPGRKVKCSRK